MFSLLSVCWIPAVLALGGKETQERLVSAGTTMSDQEIRKEEEMEEEQEEREISTSEGGNIVCEVICRGE